MPALVAQISTLKPAAGFEYYSGQVYWNDFEVVASKINWEATGSVSLPWFNIAKAPEGGFVRGLFFNCGNGWVERQMLDNGFVRSVEGFDIDERLLKEADTAALQKGFDCRYRLENANDVILPPNYYDLVVNHAAMHHVASIDKLTRS